MLGDGSIPVAIPSGHVGYEQTTLYTFCLTSLFLSLYTPQRQYSGHNSPLGHHTDCGPTGLGQYNSIGEYCGPRTASSVCLISLPWRGVDML